MDVDFKIRPTQRFRPLLVRRPVVRACEDAPPMPRADVRSALERCAEMRLARKAAVQGDTTQGLARLGEKEFRPADATSQQPLMGRHAG